MSVRNLEYLFRPRSVALIGASRPEQIEENVRLFDAGELTDNEREAIEAILTR